MLTTTPYLFFTGKGGVGKTSLACATGIQLAQEGNTVLIVRTDPASNLEDVLESKVTEEINQVIAVKNLYAININPEVSAQQYRERVTGPLKDILPEAEIKKIKEELIKLLSEAMYIGVSRDELLNIINEVEKSVKGN